MQVRIPESENGYVFPNNELAMSLCRVGILPQILSRKAFLIVSQQLKQRIMDLKSSLRLGHPIPTPPVNSVNDDAPTPPVNSVNDEAARTQIPVRESERKDRELKRRKSWSHHTREGREMVDVYGTTPRSSTRSSHIVRRKLVEEALTTRSPFAQSLQYLDLHPIILLKRVLPSTIEECQGSEVDHGETTSSTHILPF